MSRVYFGTCSLSNFNIAIRSDLDGVARGLDKSRIVATETVLFILVMRRHLEGWIRVLGGGEREYCLLPNHH